MTEDRIDQLYDIDAELRFIEASIRDNDYFIELDDDHFTNPLRRDINCVLKELFQVTHIVDDELIQEKLVKKGHSLPDLIDYWSKMDYTPSFHTQLYADKLREARRKRLLMGLAQKLTNAVFDDNTDQIERLKAAISEVERRTTHEPELSFWSSEYLLTTEFPEPVWIIMDMLPVGLGFLAGRPKAGKSWLALQLGYAVSTGKDFLGYKTNKGKVTYIALEDSEVRLQGRMKKQGQKVSTWYKFLGADQFVGKGGLRRLAEMTEDNSLLILDTFTRSMDFDQFSPQDMKNVLGPLQTAALKNDCCVLFLDHMPKGRAGRENAASVIDDVFGSVAKTGVADTIMGLYRDDSETGGTLAGTGRDIMDLSVSLSYDRDTGSWCPCEVTDRAQWGENRHDILITICDAGDISQSDIVYETGLNKGNVSRECLYLQQFGLARQFRDGRRQMWQATVSGQETRQKWDAAHSAAREMLEGNTLKGKQKALLSESDPNRTDVQGVG